MTNRAELSATLSRMEATLARAAINSVDISAGWAEIARKLDRVRPRCCELRVVLIELVRSDAPADIEKARTKSREVRAASCAKLP